MKNQSIPMITKDVCANEKILRRLERDGHIKLYVSDMELPQSGSKIIGRNSLPFGFLCDDPNCKCKEGIGGFGDGSEERPHSYWETQNNEDLFKNIVSILGTSNRRDSKQLLHHHINKRDIFVTEDRNILNASERLNKELGIVVKTPRDLDLIFRAGAEINP